MYELVELIYNLKNKPFNIILLAVILFVAEKLGRNFITSQVKRLFHIQDRSEFKTYVENQKRIEAELLFLMESQGIKWNGHVNQTNNTQTSSSRSLKLYWEMINMNLSRIQIASFIVTAAGFVKEATGYEFPNEYINLASFVIWALFTAWGIYHSKKPVEPADQFLQDGGE